MNENECMSTYYSKAQFLDLDFSQKKTLPWMLLFPRREMKLRVVVVGCNLQLKANQFTACQFVSLLSSIVGGELAG
jgi:hypothetical protein